MQIRVFQSRFANASFYLLFPGFFFYHFVVSRDLLQPVLAGFFGPVSAAIIAPLFLLCRRRLFLGTGLIQKVFFAILLLIVSTSLIHYSLGNPNNFRGEMLSWSMAGLLYCLVCYMVAGSVDVGRAMRALLPLFFVMALIVFLNIGERGIFYAKADSGSSFDYVASYQGFARSLVATLLLITAGISGKWLRLVVLVIFGLLALFLNGARSEFILYFTSLVVCFTFYSRYSLREALSFLCFLAVTAFVATIAIDYLPQSRMFQLVDLTESTSYQARWRLFQFGVDQVANNPLWGNYGGYVDQFGLGGYPHNLLSAWVNLGLIGFALFVLLFSLLWVEAIKGLRRHRMNNSFKVFFLYLIFTTSAVAISKIYLYEPIGLTIGFFVAYRKQNLGTHL